MFEYQKWNKYFAQVSDGMEDLAVQEITELGAIDVSAGFRGVYFNADQEGLYKINYFSRLLTRILAPLLTFNCHSDKYLYKTALGIEWEKLLSPEQTFAVFATVSHSNIKHSQYAALRLKDAIADYFMDILKKRPNVERMNPDVWINLYINNNKAVISLDTSGGSLHRRGYRQESVEAPFQETVAAAVIKMSEWQDKPLYDLMCGSGTILCEAAMKYCRIPSGYMREKFGFEQLPDFEPLIWEKIKKDAQKNIRDLPKGLISGSDNSVDALSSVSSNLKALNLNKLVDLSRIDFREIDRIENSVIIFNPPYGIRMKIKSGIEGFYRDIGDFLKQRCQGSTAFIYFGDRKLIASIGLKPSWKKPLKNGGLDGRLVKYELY
ncbi:MAG: class I SAM-dependent RNA methyltransferase [Spirochaetes bacterium]|nr:class I SAM-dependent RNA methyltransferase [Spirochaetota bacterium]